MAARKKLVEIKASELKVGDTLVVARQALPVSEIEEDEDGIVVHLPFNQFGSSLLQTFDPEEILVISQ
jgi:hypothetical protein